MGHAIRQESWTKTDKSLSLGTGDGSKEVLQLSPLQIVGNQRSGRRFGFQTRKPNNQDKTGGSSGTPQTEGKRKTSQGTRVGQNSSGEVNRFDGTSSNGHCATNAKDDI